MPLTGMETDLPGWFCLASPLKCIAEGPERGDKAPKRCPECGAPVGITIFGDDEDFEQRENSSEAK